MGSPIRPTALILGPSLKPISSDLNCFCSSLIPETFIKAWIPGNWELGNCFKPCLSHRRLTPIRGAKSAIVPNVKSSNKEAIMPSVLFKVWASVKAKIYATPTPANPL